MQCRAPHGARGLKYKVEHIGIRLRSRAPHGARGLKSTAAEAVAPEPSRAPHGARGLKFFIILSKLTIVLVAPRMGRVD